MVVKVAIAKVGGDAVPTQGSFYDLNDIYIDESRANLEKEDVAKLFVDIADKLTRPIVMAAESEPEVTRRIWNFETHDFGRIKFDFKSGKCLWMIMGLMDWEFDERWD